MADNVVRVCAQSDIAPETVKAYEVGDKRLAVYNLEGQYYVTDDECTHASASLADGTQIGGACAHDWRHCAGQSARSQLALRSGIATNSRLSL